MLDLCPRSLNFLMSSNVGLVQIADLLSLVRFKALLNAVRVGCVEKNEGKNFKAN